MRTSWLAVIAVALGAATTVHAQEVMKQKVPFQAIHGGGADGWAVQSPYGGVPVQPVKAMPEAAPPASLGAPVAAPLGAPAAPVGQLPPAGHDAPAGGCCAKGPRHCGCGARFCDRLLAWLCYKPHHCCCECARCCHIPPLYLFTLDECTEGAHHEYPPCICDRSGMWHGHPHKGDGQGCCGNP